MSDFCRPLMSSLKCAHRLWVLWCAVISRLTPAVESHHITDRKFPYSLCSIASQCSLVLVLTFILSVCDCCSWVCNSFIWRLKLCVKGILWSKREPACPSGPRRQENWMCSICAALTNTDWTRNLTVKETYGKMVLPVIMELIGPFFISPNCGFKVIIGVKSQFSATACELFCEIRVLECGCDMLTAPEVQIYTRPTALMAGVS